MADVGGPLVGGSGNDVLSGDARVLSVGIDNYSNSGTFALLGNGGDDIIFGDLYDPTGYDSEGDEIRGGDGNDRIYGDTAPDLSGLGVVSDWDGDPAFGTRAEGSSDRLFGDAGDDIIFGGAGFDEIRGGSGDDQLFGQNDTDNIYGEDGADQISCGTGDDQVYGGAGADVASGGAGNDLLYGEEFNTSAGDGGDTLRGDAGDDQIQGGAGADRLQGGAGSDRISGGGLSSTSANDLGDSLDGGSGNDFLDGNFGDDRILGGLGLDTLTGGSGKDQFIYEAPAESIGANTDVITDFDSAAADRINLRAIDAIPGGTDDPFIFRGSAAFTGAGQVQVTQSGGNTLVRLNLDTDNSAEMVIKLTGLITLDRADFIL